jgi:hypothetical protein
MRILNSVKPLDDYILDCEFTDGISKKVDIKPFLDKEAFKPLSNGANFLKVVNKNYFVEWLGLEIDLSADTLWHLGK